MRHSIFIGAFINLLVILPIHSLPQKIIPNNFDSLNTCERAIMGCCEKDETDIAETKLPMECFEDFGCPGLFWLGPAACSHDIINSIHMVQETPPKIVPSIDYSLRTDEDVGNTNSEQSIEDEYDYGDLFEDEEEKTIPFVITDSYMTYELGEDCRCTLVTIHFENIGATLAIDDPEKLEKFETTYLSDKVTGCISKSLSTE